MHESWFPLTRYNGKYEVSNLGYIRNRGTLTELPERTDADGHRSVNLRKGQKMNRWEKVRHLVAETFLPDYVPDSDVICKDENPANCARENLVVIRHCDGTALPERRDHPVCFRGHPLFPFNLASGGRCKACRRTRESMDDPMPEDFDAEYVRLLKASQSRRS